MLVLNTGAEREIYLGSDPQTKLTVTVPSADDWDLIQMQQAKILSEYTAAGGAAESPEAHRAQRAAFRVAISRHLTRVENAYKEGDVLQTPDEIVAWLGRLAWEPLNRITALLMGAMDLTKLEKKA